MAAITIIPITTTIPIQRGLYLEATTIIHYMIAQPGAIRQHLIQAVAVSGVVLQEVAVVEG